MINKTFLFFVLSSIGALGFCAGLYGQQNPPARTMPPAPPSQSALDASLDQTLNSAPGGSLTNPNSGRSNPALSATPAEPKKNAFPKLPVKLAIEQAFNPTLIGFFVGMATGEFEKRSIAFQFYRPSPKRVISEFLFGDAPLAIMPTEQLFQIVSSGFEVLAVANFVQTEDVFLVALDRQEIKRLADLRGKTVATRGTVIEEKLARAMIAKDSSADDGGVKFLPVSGYAGADWSGKNFQAVFVSHGWDGFKLAEFLSQAKIKSELLWFSPKDHLDFVVPSWALVVRKSWLAKNYLWLANFMDALQISYKKAVQDPNSALEYYLRYNPNENRQVVEESLAYYKDRFFDFRGTFGSFHKPVLEKFAAWMKHEQLLPAEFEVNESYTNQFLQQDLLAP